MDRLMSVFKYIAPISGGHTPTYSHQADEWMALKPLRASEKFSPEASQRYADVAVKFTSWPIDDLDIVDLLRDERGQWWDIRAITEIGYAEGIEIECTLKVTPPDIAVPPDPDPEPEGVFSYTVTAGENVSYRGFVMYDCGSIDAEPIDGATLYSTVSSRSSEGEGGIEIVGDRGVLEPLLADKEVWIGGVLIGDESHWSFDTYMATWWVEDGFPAFAVDGTYAVELKPVAPPEP